MTQGQRKRAQAAGAALISMIVLAMAFPLQCAGGGSENWQIRSELTTKQKQDTSGGNTGNITSLRDHSRQCSNNGRAITSVQTLEAQPDKSVHEHEAVSGWEADGSTWDLQRDWHTNPDRSWTRRTTETTTKADGYRETYTKDEDFDSSGKRTKLTEHITPERVDPKSAPGGEISLPCSCDGSWCAAWPLPDSFPRGYKWDRNTVESTLTSPGGGTIGNAAPEEQYKGGVCTYNVAGHPGAKSYRPDTPGTYTLTIRTIKRAGQTDCNHPTCATVPGTALSDVTEVRYYTFEEWPQCDQEK